MVIRILGKYLRLDFRTGPDCPEGHVGPCPPNKPAIEASSGGQFEFGFAPNESDPTASRRGTVEPRPVGARGTLMGFLGCGVLREPTGRNHAGGQS